jgi:hypothetical protein
MDLLLERSRRRLHDPEHPFQALVTNLDASPYVGRWRSAGSATGRARGARSPGVAPTARSSAPRSASSTSPRRSTACRRGGGPGRDRRDRRHRRGDDRRDARRSRRSAPAAGDQRRRAVAVDHDRAQHLAARRAERDEADRARSSRRASSRSSSATSRSACSTPSARTPGRSRGAASWRSRCSSS